VKQDPKAAINVFSPQLSESNGTAAPASTPEAIDIDIDVDIPPLEDPELPQSEPQLQPQTEAETPSETQEQLEQRKQLLQSEIATLRTQIPSLKADLEDIWKDDRSVAYELTSVFIHRGSSPSFGHYFFYSRNLPDKPDEWFKYNDDEVSVISKEEVFKDTTGDTANPYLLVFTRKGSQVVETVNRFEPDMEDV